MYLAMLLEEEDEVLLETCPVYSEAELASIEAEMTAYIAERDGVTWAHNKKTSTHLLRLIDHLRTLNARYEEIRVTLIGNPSNRERVQEEYYSHQAQIYKVLTEINSTRGKLL